MGFGGFDAFFAGRRGRWWGRQRLPAKKTQRAGSKGWWFGYTQLRWETQNGNPG
jgi:hypothetical protein